MKVVDNDLVMGASGKIGKMLVFRQKAGKTIIAKRGIRTAPLSVDQEAVTERFREAAIYAKKVSDDPLKKALYEAVAKPGQTAFNLALADFWKAPVVKKITLDDYNGQIGGTILVRAIDNFKVETVTVQILDGNSSILETGQAILQDNGLDWLYTATVENSSLQASTVRVTASDLPGNKTVQDQVVE
ncbi:hypothetical protein [Pseudopedobacter beijingensis]|uniref:Uncharacterized protein n=1 Tax=Pseudopedobacter beijingensis TaxID=1207056 RepID=A0ABW4I9G4_9SPHI